MVFTTVAVAAAMHYLLGWPWSVAFVLGAIVSPPDVVAPLAIARRLGLPRRLLVVLEGEGLANDATALILYRFAVVAVSTGMFSAPQGGRNLRADRRRRDHLRRRRRLAQPAAAALGAEPAGRDHAVADDAVSRLLGAASIGGSGVLATVAAGLYVSWNGPRLISASTRLQGIFFWDLIIYLIEGFVFLITGLQARTLIEKAQNFPVAEDAGRHRDHRRDRDRGALRLGVSGELSAALADPGDRRGAIPSPPWQWVFVAVVHRRARRGLARGGARHSADDRRRRCRFRIAT